MFDSASLRSSLSVLLISDYIFMKYDLDFGAVQVYLVKLGIVDKK